MFKKNLKLFCTINDKIIMFLGKAASYMMPVLAFIVVYEVAARYIFDAPTIWAYDLSLFLFGYISALGGAYAQQKRAHINVDILYLTVSPKVKNIFNIISFSLGIFFLMVIFYVSIGKFEEAIEFDFRRQSEWAPAMWHFWVMLCIASGLFIMQLTRDIVTELYHLITGDELFEKELADGC
ncbi:TRAP transporter small permease [Poseidonibacter lekithochrous]|uniref:TRAP transporter small permease subunit n=1 Tax=Poseidonibacter TaxID=2321187 RepID=UPI001C09893B|nr:MULTISPECIES: TRAP transporter small permease [Poseidonibacter]MBU3015641.1 TRAP transporter small permease [Poseidonibacter lekithochrous]MDO6828941.1 TRAP transporter small permease [Poseidonibacter sp. 1_MG-2023]